MTENWRTVDFRPAPPGWRVVHLLPADEGTTRVALPGWLIQENEDGERRVVAAEIDQDGELRPAVIGLWNVSAWYVAGPGDQAPTAEEVAQERADRAARAQSQGRP